MAIVSPLFELKPININAIEDSEYELEAGQYAFTTTGTTVEVPTNLTEVVCAVATALDPTFGTDTSADVLYCDGAITSSAITVTRGASGTSGLKFWYVFVGKRYATS